MAIPSIEIPTPWCILGKTATCILEQRHDLHILLLLHHGQWGFLSGLTIVIWQDAKRVLDRVKCVVLQPLAALDVDVTAGASL